MKRIFVFLFVVIGLYSCHKEENVVPVVSDTQCLSQHFYYYNNAPYAIDSILRNDFMIVGFDTAVVNAQIVTFINTRPEFISISASDIKQMPLDAFKFVIVKFSSLKNCSQINSIRTNLMLNNEVVLANYTYKSDAWYGGNTINTMTYTDRFMVRVNDPNNLSALDSLMLLTNTSATQNQFDNKNFLVLVKKSSPGDALKMANMFHETGLFEWSSPSFKYLNIN